jgi:hypothetical protein
MPRQKSLISVIRDLVQEEIRKAIDGLLGHGARTTKRRRRRRGRRGPGRPRATTTTRRRRGRAAASAAQ